MAHPVIEASCDVAVIGGGPAAAAASRLLAGWGYHVVVLAGAARRQPPLAESLPPSCHKPLAAIGAAEAVAAAGFIRSTGNTVCWGDVALVSQPFAGGATGYQVVRDRFDAVLLEAARAAGARVVAGASVRVVEPGPDDAVANGRTVVWTDAGGGGRLRARHVLDCSGRAGVLARRGLRRRERGPSTTALVGVWSRPGGWHLEDESHTLIESYAAGWCWSVPVSPTRRYVAAMVDPRLTAVAGGTGLQHAYLAELSKTRHLGRLLRDASLEATPRACSATPYTARRFAGDGFLLVGDAATFLDPLSSFGVKKALASGWLAAVVVHTATVDPGMAETARAFFEERERAVYGRYRELARLHYAGAARHHDHPFWRARAAATERQGFTGDAAGGGGGRAGGAVPGGWTAVGVEPDAGREPAAAPESVAAAGRGTAPRLSDLALDPPGEDPADGAGAGVGPGVAIEALLDQRLAPAFAELRRRPRVRLRPGARLARVQRPTVRDRQVVLEDHLVSPALPEGLRYLWGVELPALVELAPRHDQVPDLFEAYARRRQAVPLPRFVAALAALVALEMLEHEDSDGSDGAARSGRA